jgi:hypothetical protein
MDYLLHDELPTSEDTARFVSIKFATLKGEEIGQVQARSP